VFARPPSLRHGSISGMLPDLRSLGRKEWYLLRDVRLAALAESPRAFLATHEKEESYSQGRWLEEFDRGDWTIGELAGKPVCLVGVTRAPGAPPYERHLEYVWVAPEYRRSGVAHGMLATIIEGLQNSGAHRILLWVLDGNNTAIRLYLRLGFVSTNKIQPLEGSPGRSEEQFALNLGRPVVTGRAPGGLSGALP
jgi:ribosomal protein S18 acetylase RimI-like enzyme